MAFKRNQRCCDYDSASHVLREAGAALRAAGLDDTVLAEQSADLSVMSERYAACDVSAADTKYMYQRAYNARRGRSAKDQLIRRLKGEHEPPQL